MVESLEVKLARVEEKVDQVLRRLEAGDKRFKPAFKGYFFYPRRTQATTRKVHKTQRKALQT